MCMLRSSRSFINFLKFEISNFSHERKLKSSIAREKFNLELAIIRVSSSVRVCVCVRLFQKINRNLSLSQIRFQFREHHRM